MFNFGSGSCCSSFLFLLCFCSSGSCCSSFLFLLCFCSSSGSPFLSSNASLLLLGSLAFRSLRQGKCDLHALTLWSKVFRCIAAFDLGRLRLLGLIFRWCEFHRSVCLLSLLSMRLAVHLQRVCDLRLGVRELAKDRLEV